MVQWKDQGLVMFCDAAFAPQRARSHGGWVVTYGGVANRMAQWAPDDDSSKYSRGRAYVNA